jgi:hypothetical protein
MSKKLKIIIIIALFSFSGIYLFITTISPALFHKNTSIKREVEVKKTIDVKNSNSTPETKTLREKELDALLSSSKINNPFLSSKYLSNFAFIDKTSLSIISPPKDAIEIYDVYFVGTFLNQGTKAMQVIINKDGKDMYINKGDILNEKYGKLKLMKIYTNFLLFMDREGNKYYIQK